MKLEIKDKNLMEFTPENDAEKANLASMWNMLVDCAKFNRKLVPIGEFVPGKSEFAQFMIEGDVDPTTAIYAEMDCTVYCQTCNKYFNVKKGEQIPLCCGRSMEVMD